MCKLITYERIQIIILILQFINECTTVERIVIHYLFIYFSIYSLIEHNVPVFT